LYPFAPHFAGNKTLGSSCGGSLESTYTIELLSEVLEEVDLVCVMSVNPGFGGQKFIEHSYLKVANLKEMRTVCGTDHLICQDVLFKVTYHCRPLSTIMATEGHTVNI